jgi:bifunctional DNA-binding transcriptional regulator/antitoxin component of YhaV-PrlF toxin-antitoxin module
MFRGANKLTLDAKGRMVMPTRYRERLQERCGGKLVVTVDKDQCLLIYPLPDWEEIERKLMRLPTLNPRRGAAAADGRARDGSGARRPWPGAAAAELARVRLADPRRDADRPGTCDSNCGTRRGGTSGATNGWRATTRDRLPAELETLSL